jgi:hypothetical protein
MLERLATWLDQNAMACYYYKYLGVRCPGCGMQRSLAELLRGDITASFHHYPALMPLLFMFLFLILHLIFAFRNGAAILKYSFVINSTIIMITWVIRMIHHFNV